MSGEDALRARLLETLCLSTPPCQDHLDDLCEVLPVVEAIANERAAAELRAAAHRLDDGGDEAIEVALGGAAYVHRVLCDRAAILAPGDST